MKIFLIIFSLFACVTSLSHADEDRDRARALYQSSQIVSVEELIEKVSAEFPGQILKIELDDEDDAPSGWVYETKLLRKDGVVIEIEYDAKTLEIIEFEQGHD